MEIDNAMDGKWVFILEKAETNLDVHKNDGDFILEGVAAVFGQENNNHRIYEEKEYLPHLSYLQGKINKKSLLGELDHPASFETSLKNASHVVESLTHDKDKRQIKIRVRLINGHPAGEMAKALVEAGVPLSISSRAAGVVSENKKVKIKKIFTYDLVADPGFENAQLQRMYESVMSKFSDVKPIEKSAKSQVVSNMEDVSEKFCGEKNENLKIYSIDENNIEFLKSMQQEKNNNSDMAKEYVTVDELNDYSAIIKKEMDNLKEKIKGGDSAEVVSTGVNILEERIGKIEKYVKYLAENVDKNIQYSEYLAENVDKNVEYSKYLAENLDKTISYGEYLAENLDKNISYSDYLAENLDKNISYANYLAENLEKGISYSEYLAENLDKNITYSNYLAENLDKNISYSEYLAENVDRNISYSEYLAENVDKGICYGEYLAETVDKGITYSEYLAEKIEKNIAYSEYIAENVGAATTAPSIPASKKVNESVEIKGEAKIDYSALPSKIDQLLETVKNQKAGFTLSESKYAFFKLLSNDARKEFLALNETKKEKVVAALKTGAYFSEVDVIRIWESALVEKVEDEQPKFIKEMPENVKPIWESMVPAEKQSIVAQSRNWKLDTAYQIKNFWSTRKLTKEKPVGLVKLNENEIAAGAVKPNMRGYANNYVSAIADELDKRFKNSSLKK